MKTVIYCYLLQPDLGKMILLKYSSNMDYIQLKVLTNTNREGADSALRAYYVCFNY